MVKIDTHKNGPQHVNGDEKLHVILQMTFPAFFAFAANLSPECVDHRSNSVLLSQLLPKDVAAKMATMGVFWTTSAQVAISGADHFSYC